jgi:hypothetical protein
LQWITWGNTHSSWVYCLWLATPATPATYAAGQHIACAGAALTCTSMKAHPDRVELQRNARLSLKSSQQAKLQRQRTQDESKHNNVSVVGHM